MHRADCLSGAGGGPGDIAIFKAALAGVTPQEAFIPAVAPGTIELQRRNTYYPTDEAYLFAIAEAMREDIGPSWTPGSCSSSTNHGGHPVWHAGSCPQHCRLPEVCRTAGEAINHALAGIPSDRVRYHLCWGSWHGPHVTDVPLKDIVDIVLRVHADAYSVEAANPRHEHEWQVWEDVKLPDGKILIPGVVAHTTNIVEHPELIAWRITTYARLVGRENVIAGTDCGFSQGAFTPRVHPPSCGPSSRLWRRAQRWRPSDSGPVPAGDHSGLPRQEELRAPSS